MTKNIKISKARLSFYIALFILFLFSRNLFPLESSFYSVPVKNFSSKIYSENFSKFRIVLKNSEFTFPETVSQTILKQTQKDNDCILIIKTGINNAYALSKTENLKMYLSDSMLLNIDDPGIQKLKLRFKDSKDIISDIEIFVYNYITSKDMSMPLISASEILKDRTGDCKEHTVLSVSLLRSLGIPARAVVGMILSEEFEGQKNLFVYHMWAEAYVNNRWAIVDSAMYSKKNPNRYIAFSYHHLLTEMPLTYLKAISAMKSFSVDYIKD